MQICICLSATTPFQDYTLIWKLDFFLFFFAKAENN